jgi:uncharacterized membrane protein
MSLEPLLNAPLVVQAHVATVVPAFLLGVWLLVFSRKGLRWHRLLGGLFLGLLVTTALITLFIHRRMPDSAAFGMSPTHLFIPFVLFATWRALDGALKGKIKQHQRWVMGLFFGALVINGVNNIFFLPGITHDVLFGRQIKANLKTR